MAVTIEVWEPDGSIKRGNLTAIAAPPTPGAADPQWETDLERAGALSLYVASTSADLVAKPALLEGRPTLKVVVDGTAGPAYKLFKRPKTFGQTWDLVQLQALTLKAGVLLHALVLGYGGLEGLMPDVRLFGVQDPGFVPGAAWQTPVSRGTQGSNPFGDNRPQKWSDSQAEFIADSTDAENNEGHFWLLADLVVPETMAVRFEYTADESFVLWAAGAKLDSSSPDATHQWGNTYHKTLELPAGTHRVVGEVWHPDRPSGSTNLRWFLFSAMRAGAGGAPAAQHEVQHVHNDAGLNEVQHVHNDATGGTFTLEFGSFVTNAIAHNAAAATVEAELEALPDIDDVAVTGAGTSGDPWVVEFRGDLAKQSVATLVADDTHLTGHTTGTTVTTAQQGGDGGSFTLTFAADATTGITWDASASAVETALNALASITAAGGVTVTGGHTADNPWVVRWNAYGNQPILTADDTNLVGHTTGTTVTEVTDGSTPDVLLRSNTTDWQVLPIGSPRPGMTPGQILRVAVEEEQARGRLAGVTLGFTDTLDSDGAAWPDVYELGIPVGASLVDLCDRLAKLGIATDMDATLVLDAWADRGTDRSATVTLTKAECESGNVDRDDDVVNGLLLRVGDSWQFLEDAAAAAADGSLVDFVSLGAQPDGEQIANSLLADSVDEQDVATLTWPDSQGPDPYTDFDLGDTITVPGYAGTGVAARCLSLRARLHRTGRVIWTGEFAP